MVAPWLALADVSQTGAQAWRHQLLWAGPTIAALLLLAALVIAWVKHWTKPTPARLLTAGDQLAHFRTLYERGELSPEEFARLRALLTERMRKEAVTPPQAAPPPPASTAIQPLADGPAGPQPPAPDKHPG